MTSGSSNAEASSAAQDFPSAQPSAESQADAPEASLATDSVSQPEHARPHLPKRARTLSASSQDVHHVEDVHMSHASSQSHGTPLADYAAAPLPPPPQYSNNGCPDVSDLSGVGHGPGQFITLLLGYSTAPDFQHGSLGDWPAPTYDYHILPATFTAAPVVPKGSSSSEEGSGGSVPPPGTPCVKPTPEELQQCRPHRHAFFSKEGWHVATPWPAQPDSLSVPKELIYPCPAYSDQCASSAEIASKGLAHHFTSMPNAVDPRHLGPPARREQVHPQHSWLALLFCSTPVDSLAVAYTERHQALPFVLTQQTINDFEQSRWENPAPDASAELSVALAWDSIWRMIDDIVFKANVQVVRVDSKLFNKRVGWDAYSQAVFAQLGFQENHGKLQLPILPSENSPEEAAFNRARLIRAWLEVGMLLLQAKSKLRSSDTMPASASRVNECLSISPARDAIAPMLGGNPFTPQRTAGGWQQVGTVTSSETDQFYRMLGCTPTDPEVLLLHAYNQQVTTDPRHEPVYLTALSRIAEDTSSDILQIRVMEARSEGKWSTDDERKAYAQLGFDGASGANSSSFDPAILTDDIIADQFPRKIEFASSTEERTTLREALKLIAKIRNSDLLRVTVESTPFEAAPKMTIEQAYKVFDVPQEAADDMLQACCAIYMSDAPSREKEFKEALGLIAEARNSSFLRHYVETGEQLDSRTWEEPPEAPSNDRPVGLENIGNTCYFSSLLQYFFTVTALREAILCADQLVESDDTPSTEKRVGGRLVTTSEIKRSKRFVKHLSSLFSNLIHASSTSIRPEKDLAYLALVTSQDEQEETSLPPQQQNTATFSQEPNAEPVTSPMEMDESRAQSLPEPPAVASSASGDGSGAAHQSSQRVNEAPLVAQETKDGTTEIVPYQPPSSQPPPLPPRPQNQPPAKSRSSIHTGEMMFGKQHDVSEAMDNVMFQIDAAFDPAKVKQHFGVPSIVYNLFYGKTQQILDIPDHPTEPTRRKDETFGNLLLNVVEGGQSIYEGLDTCFQESEVDIDNQKATRRLYLSEPPRVLQIQLQRVQFDLETSRVFKSNAWMSFPPTIRLDRYLALSPADDEGHRRQKASKQYSHDLSTKRAMLARLTSPDTKDVPELLSSIAQHTEIKNNYASLSESLLAESDSLKQQVTRLELEIKQVQADLEALWEGLPPVAEYELSSVFMHRGAASFGHYWLNQRALPDQPDRWIKFNDASVTDIPAKDVYEGLPNDQTANPYWLTYVRKGEGLVQGVCREL